MPPASFDLTRIGAGLPFASAVGELATQVTRTGVAVVQAPPGTGKTTLVPPVVADLVGDEEVTPVRRVVVTQPRRIAVRAAARRLAHLTGTRLGEAVGFTVQGERAMSAATRIEFCTPGVLLRRLLADAGIPGVAAVVLDEVHERGIETDLLLGMLAEVRTLREDLRLVAMSATLDAPRFAELLGEPGTPAPIVDCLAAWHPLDIRWAPAAVPRLDARGVSRRFLDHVADMAADAHRKADGDALVFVPGAAEVDHVVRRLRSRTAGIEVLALHGRLPSREQDRVITGRSAGDPGRIVVSTALAESSLTVPGIRLVVDAGLSREPRRDAARGMSGLVTVSASRDAAIQRAGRAARLGPGTAVRCYDEATYAAMPAHLTPQIATADLVETALILACWGTPQGQGLALPDSLPPVALDDAVTTLRGLDAIDAAGQASAHGRRLAQVPTDPRHARALLDGAPIVGPRAAAEIVAMISGDARGDLARLWRELRAGRAPGAPAWSTRTIRLERLVPTGVTTPAHLPDDAVGRVVGLAFPERIARSSGDSYLFASGTRAGLAADSDLLGQEWLAVADVTRAQGRAAAGTGAVIRAAAPLRPDAAEEIGSALLSHNISLQLEGRMTARCVRALGAIELSSSPIRPPREAARAHLLGAISADLALLRWSPAASDLRRRLALLRRHLGDPWPDVSEAALAGRLEEWLGPELDDLAGGVHAGRPDRVDLLAPLRRLLPWPDASRLEELAPTRLTVASGAAVPITYPDDADARPVVAVKLQECFGWTHTPTIVDGAVPVLFHLLSPARRPLAVTDDLASFWSGPYAQVRAEMRGRYPKHPWPQDPWNATATARTTHRRR